MCFTTADNPFIRPTPKPPTKRRFTVNEDDGRERTFEETGEMSGPQRPAMPGEFVLGRGFLGPQPAVVKNRTTERLPLLREVL